LPRAVTAWGLTVMVLAAAGHMSLKSGGSCTDMAHLKSGDIMPLGLHSNPVTGLGFRV
jgi:hypothetical protein